MNKCAETEYVRLFTGEAGKSPLLTDAYKFAMGQAGFPLREETFVLSFRKGGKLIVPFDLNKVVQALLPDPPTEEESFYLSKHGFGLTPAMWEALRGTVTTHAVPVGTWVGPEEPILTVTGPSFLVSWLEANLIALQFPLQIATAVHNGVNEFKATCDNEAEIVHLVASLFGKKVRVVSDEQAYRKAVMARCHALLPALSSALGRAFECGTRSMTCYQMHRICVEECNRAGISRTANVRAAFDIKLLMIPVGTTGHEHQQRWFEDKAGFRAIRDMRPQVPSYLFDTVDPVQVGMPAVIEVVKETPDRKVTIRFDSGNQEAQLAGFVSVLGTKGNHSYIFMDDYDADRTAAMESYAAALGVPDSARQYGYGGYLVCASEDQVYRRNNIAMVYKLSQTGGIPVRKSNESKRSWPGVPVTYHKIDPRSDGTRVSVVAQHGEVLLGHVPAQPGLSTPEPSIVEASPQTKALIRACVGRIQG